MLPLLAQAAGLSIIQWVILAVIIAGVVGIAIIAFRQMGVSPPQWALQILWIVVVVIVAIVAIKFIVSLL